MTLTLTLTHDAPAALPDELVALEADSDPVVRAVGAAVARTVTGDLDPGERGWVGAIEQLRRRLDASTEEIDTSIGAPRGREKTMTMGEVAARRSKKGLWALLLLVLTRELRPRRIVELGTCLGVSGAYLGAGARLNGGGGLTTIEGAPALASRAGEHLSSLGLDAEVVAGRFREVLGPTLERVGPVDLAFVDGHHDEQATQEYFAQLLPHLAERAVVVFDDIRWSDGMERAWSAVRRDPAVRVAVDVDRVGICVTAPGDGVRQIDLPALTKLAGRRPRSSQPAAARPPELDRLPVARLSWGCGARGEPGWLNSDVRSGPGVQLVGDIRHGLALPDACLDYVVSIHALQEIALPDLVPVLGELHRVLRPGGVLRLALPDLESGVDAWRRGDGDRFAVPDDEAATLSGKAIVHLLWYGHSVSLFTAEWAEELLRKAGFREVHRCAFRRTASAFPGITDLDDREAESLFVEGVRRVRGAAPGEAMTERQRGHGGRASASDPAADRPGAQPREKR